MAYYDKKQGGGRPRQGRQIARAQGTADQLRELLARIDHRGYPAYKDLTGQWDFAGYTLVIDHVQGDPFASPSSVHVEVSGKKAGFPESLYDRTWKKTAIVLCASCLSGLFHIVQKIRRFIRRFCLLTQIIP